VAREKRIGEVSAVHVQWCGEIMRRQGTDIKRIVVTDSGTVIAPYNSKCYNKL
jgi:hypothetical protein